MIPQHVSDKSLLYPKRNREIFLQMCHSWSALNGATSKCLKAVSGAIPQIWTTDQSPSHSFKSQIEKNQFHDPQMKLLIGQQILQMLPKHYNLKEKLDVILYRDSVSPYCLETLLWEVSHKLHAELFYCTTSRNVTFDWGRDKLFQ